MKCYKWLHLYWYLIAFKFYCLVQLILRHVNFCRIILCRSLFNNNDLQSYMLKMHLHNHFKHFISNCNIDYLRANKNHPEHMDLTHGVDLEMMATNILLSTELQNWSLTARYCLVSYQDTLLGSITPLQRMQPAYSKPLQHSVTFMHYYPIAIIHLKVAFSHP